MKRKYEESEELRKLGEELVANLAKFEPIRRSDCQIAYLCSSKDKTSRGREVFGECEKVNEKAATLSGYDFIITFYVAGMQLSREGKRRLMEHELMHIGINDQTGAFYVVPHDLEDFREIVEKYGVDWTDCKDNGYEEGEDDGADE